VNEENIRSTARALEISPYELIKRQLRFRQAPMGSLDTCRFCKSVVVPKFRNGKEGMQCQRIGIMEDDGAWVGNETTCDHQKTK
jgi:hypothetical protein